ncbi:MAG: hypothetical protein ASARMPRED_008537 [Alectoria sarmentosa]|nr:MAG: hypothetical protein ASARMPRED_008537 [Alectoria sarmentosa]
MRFSESNKPKTSTMYTIKSALGKGQGMFAVQKIQAGVRILDDEVLFSIRNSTVNEGIGERISVSLGNLPPEQQQQFETLHCPDHPTWTPLVSRFLANCFEMRPPGSGIFLKAARINHSCCPNAFFSWNSNLQRVTIHAMVDIPAGDEITISYIFPFFSLETRQAVFREHYAFGCDCPACNLETLAGQSGERRRKRMDNLCLSVDKCNGGPSNNDEKELRMALEFIELAVDEHLDGEFLSCMYRRARECYEDKGSGDLALRYAEMELETDKRLLGEDHPATIKSARALEKLKGRLAEVRQRERDGERMDAS